MAHPSVVACPVCGNYEVYQLRIDVDLGYLVGPLTCGSCGWRDTALEVENSESTERIVGKPEDQRDVVTTEHL